MKHKGGLRVAHSCVLAFVTALLVGNSVFAQRLFWDSVGVLPGTLTRVEYQDLKALRNMPHFPSLRRTYGGSALSSLERWLAAFGLSEENITELVVGLEGDKAGRHIFAIAGGKFFPTPPAEAGSAQPRFVPTNIGELAGYCEGPLSEGRYCGVFKAQSWAALGRRKFLSYVAEGGDGFIEPLSSASEFRDLVAIIPRDAPLWAAMREEAAVAWLKAVIPFEDSMPIVWPAALHGLDWLTYGVTPDEDVVHITIDLEYKSSSGASFFGAVLEGVKAIEAILWQRGHPGVSNPFSDAQVVVEDRTVSLALSASYQTLESGVVLGSAH